MNQFDPEAWKNWDAGSRERAATMLAAAMDTDRKVWYCSSPGRLCDGKPHEGYPYRHARSDQWPPPGVDWFVWLIKSGRGAGKTRTGAEWTRKSSEKVPRLALVGRRGKDVRGTMVEGPSGLIYACERAQVGYDWKPALGEFAFDNGAKAFTYSAEEPDSLRGPQHGYAWLDEPAHMDLIQDVWDNLLMGMRLEGIPGGARILCTSTPLPKAWLKELIAQPDTITVTVPTSVNFDNLDARFQKNVTARYEGTRQGRQELYGEIVEDVDGALWSEEMFHREEYLDLGFDEVAIGVDPAGTANKRSDATGIVVCARKGEMFYVIEDGTARLSPEGWASRVDMFYDKHAADWVIPEKNFGSDMVLSTLRNSSHAAVRIKPVQARRGKALRAHPIVALYEQGRVKHIPYPGTSLEALEQEQIEWVPGKGDSPNRIDALVHALTHLANLSESASIAAPDGEMIRDHQRMGMLPPARNLWELPSSA